MFFQDIENFIHVSSGSCYGRYRESLHRKLQALDSASNVVDRLSVISGELVKSHTSSVRRSPIIGFLMSVCHIFSADFGQYVQICEAQGII